MGCVFGSFKDCIKYAKYADMVANAFPNFKKRGMEDAPIAFRKTPQVVRLPQTQWRYAFQIADRQC